MLTRGYTRKETHGADGSGVPAKKNPHGAHGKYRSGAGSDAKAAVHVRG